MDEQTQSGQFITIKEFFDLRIEPMSQEISRMRRAIQELNKGMVSTAEWQRMNEKCNKQEERQDALDERLDRLEHYHSTGMWAFRILTGIATAVTIAFVIKWLVG